MLDDDFFSSLPTVDDPLVAEGVGKSWPVCEKWCPEYVLEKFKEKLNFIMVKRTASGVEYGRTCGKVSATTSEFGAWLSSSCTDDSPFAAFPIEEFWASTDNIYINKDSCYADLVNDFCWSEVHPSLPGSFNSKCWLGTDGAYKACHYDSYGVNLVLQVFGCRRWILFPPSESPYMYQTRIPLEESTVFSEVDCINPDFTRHPLFQRTSPYVVNLKPGDILYIPPTWWYFVISQPGVLPLTCSVNLLIDLSDTDNLFRFKEILSKISVLSLLESSDVVEPQLRTYMFPNEMTTFGNPEWIDDAIDDLNTLLPQLKKSVTVRAAKRPRRRAQPSRSWDLVKRCLLSNLYPSSFAEDRVETDDPFDLNSIIKAFSHPDVITIVMKQLM